MADRHVTVAFADRFVLDMRMRHTFVGCGRIGVQGNDSIVVRVAINQVTPIQPNLKRAKVDAFQDDWLSRHGH